MKTLKKLSLLFLLNLIYLVNIYALDIKKDYKEQYMINLHNWLPNSFEELKGKTEDELYELAKTKYHYHNKNDKTNLYNKDELKEIEKFIDPEKLNNYFVVLLNEERAKKGLSNNIKANKFLIKAAKIRSEEMAKESKVSHKRPTGEDFWTVLEEVHQLFSYLSSFENALVVSMDSEAQMISEKFLAERFFQMWKDSPRHLEAMMDPDITNIGLNFALGFPINKNMIIHNNYAILLGIK